MSGGQKQAPAEAPKLPESIPGSAEAAAGDALDGLGGLIEQFQKKGLGDVIDFLGQQRQEQERGARSGVGGARWRCRQRAFPPYRPVARPGRGRIGPYAAECRG